MDLEKMMKARKVVAVNNISTNEKKNKKKRKRKIWRNNKRINENNQSQFISYFLLTAREKKNNK